MLYLIDAFTLRFSPVNGNLTLPLADRPVLTDQDSLAPSVCRDVITFCNRFWLYGSENMLSNEESIPTSRGLLSKVAFSDWELLVPVLKLNLGEREIEYFLSIFLENVAFQFNDVELE